MGADRELATWLPDDVSPVTVLIGSPPLLREIDRAVRDHYRIRRPAALGTPARGLVIVLARRYTRTTLQELSDWIGISPGNVSSQYGKTSARLEVIDLLRDDYDIIERRIAHMVISRTGRAP